MIIMKFGGSSVRDAERIKEVTKIVSDRLKEKPVLVFSAMGKTTDNLLQAAKNALAGSVNISEIRDSHLKTCKDLGIKSDEVEKLLNDLERLLSGVCLLGELSDQTSDHLVSYGERLSVRVVAEYWNSIGIKAKFFDGWEVGFRTDSNFKDAQLDEQTYSDISQILGGLKENYTYTPVVTGFIAWDKNKKITTLGRGGSDLTAAVLGAALKANEIQVWKDVDGILTTDPRLVSTAKPVEQISFQEASELAYFGAKVLHPLSMRPAMQFNVPVRVKNSYKAEAPGTLISNQTSSKSIVKAITFKRQITIIDIISSQMIGQVGFLSGLFKVFADHNLSIDTVATSEVSVSLTLNKGCEVDPAILDLKKIANINIERHRALVSLICNTDHSSEIISRTFGIMHKLGFNVHLISQGASQVNISFVVEDEQLESTIKAIHTEFFGS